MPGTMDRVSQIFTSSIRDFLIPSRIPGIDTVSGRTAKNRSMLQAGTAIAKGVAAFACAYLAYSSSVLSDDSPNAKSLLFDSDSDAIAPLVQANHLMLMVTAAYSLAALQSGSSIISSVAAASASMMLGVSDLVQPVIAQGSDTTFFQVFGASGYDRGRSIKATADGGCVVTGYSGYGAGNDDLFLAKFSATGVLNWAKSVGGLARDRAYAIELSSDGGLVVAGMTSSIGASADNILLSKFFQNGTLAWAKVIDGFSAAFSLTVMQDQSIVICGGNSDAFIAKFTTHGIFSWARTLDDIVVANSVDECRSITETSDAGILAAINSYDSSSGPVNSQDILLAKYSSSGLLNWAKRINAGGYDEVHAVKATIDGGAIITGESNSFSSNEGGTLLAKFFSNGDVSWARTFGGTAINYDGRGYSLDLVNNQSVLVSGTAYYNTGSRAIFLTKFTADGNLIWGRIWGQPQEDRSYSVSSSLNEQIFLTGSTERNPGGLDDLVVMKLNLNGSIENCTEVQDVIPTVHNVSLPVTVNAPTVLNVTPTLQDWNVTAVDITPDLLGQCFYYPPTTGTTGSTATTATTAVGGTMGSAVTGITSQATPSTQSPTQQTVPGGSNTASSSSAAVDTAVNVGLLLGLLFSGGVVVTCFVAAALFYYRRRSSEQHTSTSSDFSTTSDSLDATHLATPRIDSEHYQNAQLVDRRTAGRAGESSPGYGVMPEPADNDLSDASTTSSSSSTEDAVYGDALPAMATASAGVAQVPQSQAVLQEIAHADLEYGDILGEGGFGTVYQGVWHDSTVAIKQLKQQSLTEDSVAELHAEATIMSQLHNPHVLQFYGFCFDAPHFALVMEYMPEGSMYGLLHSDQALGWDARTTMGIDIGAGLAYLHKRDILHRDLKSMNVLLYQQGGQYRCKLTDFGLSKIKTETKTITADSGQGTLAWMGPELFGRRAVYAKASDIYSYAVVLWELATRATPFSDAHNPALIAKWVGDGEREDIPSDVPVPIRDVITEAWAQDPASRLSATQIVKRLKASQADIASALVSQEAQPTKAGMADNFASQRPKAGAQGKVAHNLASAAARPESGKPLRTGPGLFQGNNADKSRSTNPFLSSFSFGSSSSD